jgi:hypothetical protein
MQPPEFFEQKGTRGFYRPVAVGTFERAVDLVAEAMRFARERGLADLLVNTCELTGFPVPDTFARYSLALKWAESAGGALRVAMVTRPEIIDPQKIGVLMAQNRGANGDVFTNETDALAWLDARI